MVSYIKAFMQDPKVASIAPTPVSCIRKLLAPVPLENCSLVVELGPGNGNFTKEILQRLPRSAKLICLETNQQFFNSLEQRFADEPRVNILNENALFLRSLLKFRKLGEADLIISGIPLSFLNAEERKLFFGSLYDSITGRGRVLLYQVLSPGKEKGLRELGVRYFADINAMKLWKALPPLVAVTFSSPLPKLKKRTAGGEGLIEHRSAG